MTGSYDPWRVLRSLAKAILACWAVLRILARFAPSRSHALRSSNSTRAALDSQNDRLRAAVRLSGVGLWEWDRATDLFECDESLQRMYGNQQAGRPVTRTAWKRCVHPEDRPRLDRLWDESLRTGTTYENEYRVLLKSGEERTYKSMASMVRDGKNTVVRAVGMTWDVTREREKERHTAELAERFRKTLEAIDDGVITLDPQHCILYMNHAASSLTGWRSDDATGRVLEEVFQTRDESSGLPRRNPVERCREAGGTLLSEDGVLLSRGGGRYNIRKHVALIGTNGSSVITFQDITEARKMQKELQYAATHDPLTGLHNRGTCERALQRISQQTEGSVREHSLCILDLDRFKAVNDTAGHLAGDACLRHIASVLLAHARPQDCMARMGGDEFMLLLPDTTAAEAEALANSLLASMRSSHFLWNGASCDVSGSLGLVTFGQDAPAPEQLVSQADAACFQAKRNGRNQVVVHGGALVEKHAETEAVTA